MLSIIRRLSRQFLGDKNSFVTDTLFGYWVLVLIKEDKLACLFKQHRRKSGVARDTRYAVEESERGSPGVDVHGRAKQLAQRCLLTRKLRCFLLAKTPVF